MVDKERVCVTGAGGFIASWIVKFLLSKGYIVHGTTRNPSDEKNVHLKILDKATENLKLFKADLQDCRSLCAAITGCTGVFYVAGPVPVGPVATPEVIEPVITGTRNVLRACSEMKVKRVVVVSSIAAVIMNPNWPKDQPMDETCWSDEEHCKKFENEYYLAKTVSESEALRYAKTKNLDIITICPSLAFGPMLQSELNSSSMILAKILKDECKTMLNIVRRVVDVRDVAQAVLLAYEKPEAEGRYICSAFLDEKQDFVDKLKRIYPNFSPMNEKAEIERRLENMRSEREIVEKERVCVTGAGGFIASWIVKLLLSKGYIVHGTVRDPSDEKNAHLKLLENATENLQLFKADLQDYNSLCGAIAGCTGVFHVASPVPAGRAANPEVEVIEPVMRGTRNILMACSEIKVKRLVVVSSVVSVIKNPDWPKDQPMDESCWSDEEHCRKTENWYYFAKSASEREALEYSKKNDLDVITICPSVALGPMLQSTVNSSSMILIKILKDGCERMLNFVRLVVDVRDFAEAVLLVYEKPEAEGRYLCSAPSVERQDFVDKLKSIYPKFSCLPMTPGEEKGQELNCEKLQKLGWTTRPLEETLLDSVQDYLEKEILDKHF